MLTLVLRPAMKIERLMTEDFIGGVLAMEWWPGPDLIQVHDGNSSPGRMPHTKSLKGRQSNPFIYVTVDQGDPVSSHSPAWRRDGEPPHEPHPHP
jgi:hypothetical protein